MRCGPKRCRLFVDFLLMTSLQQFSFINVETLRHCSLRSRFKKVISNHRQTQPDGDTSQRQLDAQTRESLAKFEKNSVKGGRGMLQVRMWFKTVHLWWRTLIVCMVHALTRATFKSTDISFLSSQTHFSSAANGSLCPTTPFFVALHRHLANSAIIFVLFPILFLSILGARCIDAPHTLWWRN